MVSSNSITLTEREQRCSDRLADQHNSTRIINQFSDIKKEIFYLEEFGDAVASMYVSAMVVVNVLYEKSVFLKYILHQRFDCKRFLIDQSFVIPRARGISVVPFPPEVWKNLVWLWPCVRNMSCDFLFAGKWRSWDYKNIKSEQQFLLAISRIIILLLCSLRQLLLSITWPH